MGKNLCSDLFFIDTVCKNGHHLFRHRIKLTGIDGFFHGISHDRNGNMYNYLYSSRWNGSVIWTEVVQGIIKTLGALLILFLVIKEIPGGFSKVIEIATADNKLSLGSYSPNFIQSTFWVVLLYGFFINLNNFGMDQNYIQRYHTARSAKQAGKSVWLCVAMYVPAPYCFLLLVHLICIL
jgi:Na+/proline symporter